jgi:hypothetical protein
MSVCNLEQLGDLKKALEQYVNVLVKDSVKNKNFDPVFITKKVYYTTFTKNQDHAQALGIAYHIPSIINNLFKANPELDISQDLSGKQLDNLKSLLDTVKTVDGLDKLSKLLGLQGKSLEEIQKEIANQVKPQQIKIEVIKDGVVEESDLLFPTEIAKTTGQQLQEENGKPIRNKTNPQKDIYYKVLGNILEQNQGVELTFSDIEYSNHKGFRLLALKESELPANNLYPGRTASDNIVTAIVDNNGNFLYFNEDGAIVQEGEGKIAYFIIGSVDSSKLESIKTRLQNDLVKQYETIAEQKGIKEDLGTIYSKVDKIIENRLKQEQVYIKSLIEKAKQENVLLEITGGMIGIPVVPANKTEKSLLKEFDITEEQKRSISILTDKNGRSVPHLTFGNGINISISNPLKINQRSADAEVLNSMLDILLNDVKLLGKSLTANDKINYIRQFINLKSNINITSDGIFVDNKRLDIENDKEGSKEILKSNLGEYYITFIKGPYNSNNLEFYKIGEENELDVANLNYYDFIAERHNLNVIKNETNNKPLIVNGYFTFENANAQIEINKQVKEVVQKAEEDNTNNNTFELPDVNGDEFVYRSKLLEEVPTTAEQEKRAKQFLESHPIFKAVDENGKKLISTDFTRTLVNSDAWASFSNAAVTLYQGASYTHGYHEAWHAFSQLYLTKKERDNLYKSTAKLKGSFQVIKKTGGPAGNNYEKVTVKFSDLNPNNKADRLLLEEFIAEEFRIFSINKGKFKTENEKANIFKKVFNRVWELLKNLFKNSTNVYSNPGSKSVLDEMFNILYTAKSEKDISKFQYNVDNVEFGTLNSGILAENGDTILNYQEAMELTNSIDGIISLYTENFIKQGKAKGEIRNGFVLSSITSPKNQVKIYNEIVKVAFSNELEKTNDLIKTVNSDIQKDILKRKIKVLTTALKEENFGNIEDVLAGKANTNSVVAFHKEHSAFNDIFTITDYDVEIDETDEKKLEYLERMGEKPANGSKSQDIAAKETLYLVKSLYKQNEDGTIKLNSLGFPEPVDFISTWRVIVDKLTGERHIEGLYNKLGETIKNNVAPYFKQLETKLGNPTVVMKNENAAKMWLSFWRSLNLYSMPLITTQYEINYGEDNAIKLDVKVGKASAQYYKIKKKDWPSKFAQETSIFVKKKSDTKENMLDLSEIKKAFFNKQEIFDSKDQIIYTVDKSNYLKFLNSIGLYLTNDPSIEKELKEEDVKYIAQAIGLAEYNNLEITDPIDFLSKNQNFKIKYKSGKEGYISYNSSVGRIDSLALLEAEHSIEYASQMVKAASGNLKSTASLNSTYTQILGSISEIKEKGQMFDTTGDYKHLSYLNPEFNPNAAASITLNSLFDPRTGMANSNNGIYVADMDGVAYVGLDGTVEGIPYSKMTKLDKVFTDITSLLFYGVKEATSRAGEKKTYLGIKVKKYNTYLNKQTDYLFADTQGFIKDANGEYFDPLIQEKILDSIIYPKIEAEMKRIKMIKDNYEYYKNYNGFEKDKALQFTNFDDVLEQEKVEDKPSLKEVLLSDDILNQLSNRSLKEILRDNKNLSADLKQQVISYFNNLTDLNIQYYKDSTKTNVIPAELQKAFEKKFISLDDKNQLKVKEKLEQLGQAKNEALRNGIIRSFVLNSWVYTAEAGALIHTDFFQFNHAKAEGTKRIPPYQSPGTIFATSSVANNFVNTFAQREFEKKLMAEGKIPQKELKKHDGTFNTAIIKDSVIKSAYFDMYAEMFKNALIRKGITDEAQINRELYGDGIDENGMPKGGRMKPYAEIKEADGQGYITIDSYRILKKLESDWSDAQEKVYKDIIEGKSIAADELASLFPVYKLGYAGTLAIKDKYPINSIHKFSLFPLIPGVIDGKIYEQLNTEMIKQGMDYILFESGSKQSYIKNSPDSKGDDIFEKNDTSRLKEGFEFTNNPIYVAYLKNQTKVNDYFKGQSTLATQLRKLFNVSLYAEGKSINEKAKENTDKVFSLIDRLVSLKRADILRKLKFTQDPKTSKIEGDIQELVKFVKKELQKQGYSQAEIDYIDTDSNGVVDLSTHPASPRIEKALLSIINNRIVRLKVTGEPLVEVSNVFAQDVNYRKPDKKELETYGTSGIRGYIVDVNGEKNTKAFGVKIALNESYQNLFQTNYFAKDNKGNYVRSGQIAVYKKDKDGKKELDFKASFNRLNEMLKVNQWLNDDSNRLKIRLTGVRIPVQGPNSAEFAEVQEFLPPQAGNIVIIPAEIVAKSGTDFDVDKLTSYSKYISTKGTLFKDSFKTYEELEDYIKQLEERYEKEKLKAVKGEIKTKLTEKQLKWAFIKDNLADFRQAIFDVAETSYVGNFKALTTKNNKELLENLQNKKLQEYLKNNLKDAYSIFASKIENFDRKDYDNILEALDDLYAEKTSLSKTAIELSLAKEQKRNFTKVVENNLIDALTDVLSMPEMADVLLAPNDTHLTKYITEDSKDEKGLKKIIQENDNKRDFEKSIMTGKKNKAKGISATRMLEPDYNTEKQQDNISGGQGLGIVAVGGTNSNQFRIHGAKLNKTMPIVIKTENKDEKAVDFSINDAIKLRYQTTKDGSISLSHIKDVNDENLVSEIISQLLNGFVDIGKDEWVAYIQGNPTVIPKILFLVDAGVPYEEIAYFMTNPMIRAYVNLESNYRAPLSKLIYGSDHDSSRAKSMAKKIMLDKISTKNAPKDYSVNKDNVYGLQVLLNYLHPDSKFTTEELKATALQKLNFGPAQSAGFIQYLLIEDLMADYDRMKMTLNPDTSTEPNLFEAKVKLREIKGLENSPTINSDLLPKILEGGALGPFMVYDFANDLFSPLFKTRTDEKLINYLLNTVENYKVFNRIKDVTGQDAYKFAIGYQNALYHYFFVNGLKQYKTGDTHYNQIPINELINLEEVIDDFNNKTCFNPLAYINKGLFYVEQAAFQDAKVEDFIEFALEREYLRKTYSYEYVKQQQLFNQKYNELKINSFNNNMFANSETAAKYAYENWLNQIALKNTYNNYKLFKSGKNTIAAELMDIIKNNPVLGKKYTIIDKFVARAIPNQKDKKYTGILNFTLTDQADMDEAKMNDYRRQLKELGDPSFIKIPGSLALNEYISNFFSDLPMYTFLQSGMNSSEFNLMTVMPLDKYKRVMSKASVDMNKLFNSKNANEFFEGFTEFYKVNLNSKNFALRNRGLNWNKSVDEVKGLKVNNALNINNLLFVTEVKPGIYIIDQTSSEYKKLLANASMSGESNPNNKVLSSIKENNPEVLVMNSLSDLNREFKLMPTESLEKSKASIDAAINELANIQKSGKDIIFTSYFFDNTVFNKKTTEQLSTQPQTTKTDELSLYLSNKTNKNFGVTNPDIKAGPSIDDIVNQHVPTNKNDIDNKKNECE